MVTASPKVSVLMPVCNGMPFLTDAIDSILAQTFDDFEFVIIDDGSSDESREVLKRYASRDRRIKLLLNDTNTGIAQVLNAGIDVCRGEYIARMDCDDLSLPQRFARQVDLMDRAPEVGVCGTWFTTFGHACGTYDHPVHDSDIKIHHLLHNAAIGHPTAFLRRRVLQETGIKYPDVAAHDLWFWINLGFATKLRNLPAPLLSYRIHQNQFSRVSNSQQYASATEARLFFAGRIFGRELTEPEKTAHRALSGGTVIAD
ncbi:MAG: glycosyl transferase family 2, partial [Frankiales bacterium]|nr:glycosyl transferase family 2 [Frankiales bacterium]